MQVYYYANSRRKEEWNREGRDYTPGVIPLILSLLGVSARAVDTDGLLDGTLQAEDILFTGKEALPAGFRFDGTHVAFATEGELSAFGLALEGETAKVGDKYSIDGYIQWEAAGKSCQLPVFSAFTRVQPQGAEVLAIARTADGEELPVLLRKGNKTYFAFDLPATVWYSGDGRPTTEGKNGFAIGRVSDGRPVPEDYDVSIAYTDYMAYILQDILYGCGMPMIHRLPPMADGKVPDFLLYFSGDDDADSTENDLKAAAVMAQRGLPYHMNVMPADTEGHFVIDKEQHDRLVAQGCEIAVHPNFFWIASYGEEGYRVQAEMFRQAFGRTSVTTVNHCLAQHGSCAERLRFEEKQGILGDNNKLGEMNKEDVNAFNGCGFTFGSSFPRYTLDDAAHNNALIDVVEIPNTYYEPRMYTCSAEEKKKIHDYLDQCAFWGRTGGLFFHPHYISGVITDATPALAALDEALAYMAQKGYAVYTTAPDALTLWWRARAGSVISDVTAGGFTLDSEADGLILRLPQGVRDVRLDGREADTVESRWRAACTPCSPSKAREGIR